MGSRKLDELSNAGVPDDEIVAVPIQIIGKADQAITGTHDAEHSINALAMEREVEPGVFTEILVVIPMQSVHFFFDFVPSQALHRLREVLGAEPEEEEGVVVFGGGVAEIVGNEGGALDEGFP